MRVYYEDTDAGGVVYHARYLNFCERARTEFLRALGLDHRRLAAEHGLLFTVRHVRLDFLAPARLDDELLVVSRIERARGARVIMRQRVEREGAPLALADIELAFVDHDVRPRRPPRDFADVLAAWTVAREAQASP